MLYCYYLSVILVLFLGCFSPFYHPNGPQTRAMGIYSATDSTAKECTSEVVNVNVTSHDLRLMRQS